MELRKLLQDGVELVDASPVTPVPIIVKDTTNEIQHLIEKSGKSLHIVIMGAVKAGKSSLVNALAREEISPVGVTETTATIMRVLYGLEKRAEIIMDNQSPINGSIEQIMNILREHKGDVNFFDHCKEVCVYLPESDLRDVEIVDTPGLNTLTTSNQEKSLNYLQHADVILWMLHGQYLGQADVEDELEQLYDMGKKMLCVISRADQFNANEKTRILRFASERYGDFFEKIFLLSGNEAMDAAMANDEKGISTSGLRDIKDYIRANYMEKADSVHVESLLDSLQASIKKDISYHEDLLEKQKQQQKIKKQNYDNMVKDLNRQSEEIQQDFRRHFERWVKTDLLHKPVVHLIQEIDHATFPIKNNLRKNIAPIWKDTFSPQRIENELDIYTKKQSEKLTSMWDAVLSKLTKQYDFNLISNANMLGNTDNLSSLDSDDSSISSSIAKGTMIGAVSGIGASAYAAGLGTYAAHLSMIGAMGSFMIPALAIGAAAGIAKQYYDFNKDKQQLKMQTKDTVLEVREQVKSLIQSDYENRIADICQDICNKAKELILRKNFAHGSLDEADNYNQKISIHIKKLRGYLNAAPSYESVTDELRQEIQTIRQSMEAKTQEYLTKMEADTSSGWSEEEVNQKIQQMSAELEKEKQKQIAAITKNNDEKQQLLAATNRDLEIQMQTAEQKLRQMAQRMQEKDEKLHENSIKLQEKDKLLKQQSKELKSLEKMLKEMDVRIQEMKDSNKVVSNQSIHAELMNMMKNAKHEVDIMSPWVSHSIVNQEFKHIVQEMIDRGVTLKIVYGIENRYNKNNRYQKEDRDRLDESESMLNSLKNLRNAHTHVFSKYFSSHVKLVLCDDDSYILTSCNVLSNKGTNWEEVGEISNNKTLLQEYRKKFFDFP